MSFVRFLLVGLLFFVAHLSQAQDCKGVYNNPSQVALEIINSVKDGHLETINCFLHTENQNRFEDSKNENAFIKGGKSLFKGVDTIEEVKMGPPLDEKYTFLCKLKDEGEVVLVMLISQENGQYFFEDVTTISADQWEILPGI